MVKNKLILAVLLSVGLHIAAPVAETIAEKHGANMQPFDAIISWPAWLCSVLVPEGHGVPQLVFPFVFSSVFYAAVFWLLIHLYQIIRKKIPSRE